MKLLSKFLLILGFGAVLLAPAVASAQNVLDPTCNQLTPSQRAESTLCQENDDTKNDTSNSNSLYGPDGIVTKAVSILSLAVGIAAVVMIIIGGIRYATSSGDPNNVNGAKNTIMYAIIGLIVAALAQTLIVYVIGKI